MTFRLVAILIAITSLNVLGWSQQATGGGIPAGTFSDADIPRDNLEGNYQIQEVDLIQPFWTRGNFLATFNRPLGQFVIYTIEPFRRIHMGSLGMGPNSIVEHPSRPFEFWITDALSHCVSIWNPVTFTIDRTIPTAGAPHGIVFNDTGDRAYVTCATGRTVDVIDGNTYAHVDSVAVNVRDPRGIAWMNGKVYIAPFISGNHTSTVGADFSRIVDLQTYLGGTLVPLVDEDVLVLQPNSSGSLDLVPAETVNAVGTTLLNMTARPGTQELWLPNTEALTLQVGEPDFVDGKVVSNRVSIVNAAAGMTTVIDLDAIATGTRAAQPRAVIFDTPRGRAYVPCEGSDAIAILDNAGNWLGHFSLPAQGGIRTMPHSATMAKNGQFLIVYCYGTNSLLRIDLTTANFGDVFVNHETLGVNPEGRDVQIGRGIINNADLSAGGTSSCASCHVSGHTNQTVYDLGDHIHPPGTGFNQVQAWLDNKGPMVTQSLRGLFEAAPLHWRGERRDIEAFNGAFESLLKGDTLDDIDLEAMTNYVKGLVYPANPFQELDRSTTPDQLEGARLFIEENATGGNATCAQCHALPLGTNGEVMLETAGQANSFVVTQLRDVANKDVGEHVYLFDAMGNPVDSTGKIGPALLHNGTIATLEEFIDVFPGIDAPQGEKIEEFLRAFDSGIARSAAHQSTVRIDNAATYTDHVFFTQQAQAKNCDVMVVGSVTFPDGTLLNAQYGYFAPADIFVPWDPALPWLDKQVFVDLASLGLGSWTFIGTPYGMGFRKSVDQDGDTLVDKQEAPLGTDPENPDSDGDNLPDGFEVRDGTDPLMGGHGTNDMVAPAVISATETWHNTNTSRLSIETNEYCEITATWTGLRGPESQKSPAYGPMDFRHGFTINFLPPFQTTTVSFVAVDPAGNSTPFTLDVTTDIWEIPHKSRVEDLDIQTGPVAIGMSMGTTIATTVATLSVEMSVLTGASPLDLEVEGFAYVKDGAGGIQILNAANFIGLTDAAGVVTFTQNISWDPTLGPAKLYFGVLFSTDMNPAAPLIGYTEAFDIENVISIDL